MDTTRVLAKTSLQGTEAPVPGRAGPRGPEVPGGPGGIPPAPALSKPLGDGRGSSWGWRQCSAAPGLASGQTSRV